MRRRIYDSINDTCFDTPLIRLRKVIPSHHANVYVKCEAFNPMSSVKDRIAEAMIRAAEDAGTIGPGTHVVEPTSGNTGIALAFVCACRGYRITLTMPESMSLERRVLLRALGAQVELTAADGGMPAAIERARAIAAADPDAWIPGQFENPANPAVHEATTGPEIWADTEGKIDMMVTGVGTGGTITGTTRFLRKKNPSFKAIAVEPSDSPVIAGGPPGKHRIQGIGAGFIPANLDVDLLDGVEAVGSADAFEWARRLATEEGMLAGISTGANICAAARLASRPEYKDAAIVTVMASCGERYLSTPLYQDLREESDPAPRTSESRPRAQHP